ncbi:MAG: SMI1/KNR4 family protein [Oscillospiraceae bacterium]|nr:SMI1/KNR4 family protein [Oscillospiraceae bacterium]
MALFDGIDLSRLFDNESEYGKRYCFGDITDALIQRAEAKMGFRIPPSYRELLSFRNGGMISDELDESWLTAIYGISEEPDAENGLEEMFDNWREEWEYPDIGIPFGETQSAGHDMYYLDCRATDANGEPRIVRVDVEDMDEPKIYLVAENLADFIRLILKNEELAETLLED